MRTSAQVLICICIFVIPAFLHPVSHGLSEDSQSQFEISLPSNIDSNQVQIRYFLTGAFGGYGSFVREGSGKHKYIIDTTVERRPAETLKVIVYAPGCQVVTISVASLSNSSRQADFICEKLALIPFFSASLN